MTALRGYFGYIVLLLFHIWKKKEHNERERNMINAYSFFAERCSNHCETMMSQWLPHRSEIQNDIMKDSEILKIYETRKKKWKTLMSFSKHIQVRVVWYWLRKLCCYNLHYYLYLSVLYECIPYFYIPIWHPHLLKYTFLSHLLLIITFTSRYIRPIFFAPHLFHVSSAPLQRCSISITNGEIRSWLRLSTAGRGGSNRDFISRPWIHLTFSRRYTTSPTASTTWIDSRKPPVHAVYPAKNVPGTLESPLAWRSVHKATLSTSKFNNSIFNTLIKFVKHFALFSRTPDRFPKSIWFYLIILCRSTHYVFHEQWLFKSLRSAVMQAVEECSPID